MSASVDSDTRELITRDASLPVELADRLVGDSVQTLSADAEELARLVPTSQ